MMHGNSNIKLLCLLWQNGKVQGHVSGSIKRNNIIMNLKKQLSR